jgi:hypothetical protein
MLTRKTKKLVFHFFIFLRFYNEFCKTRPKAIKDERIYLQVDPWKDLNLHRSALGLHKGPWKELGARNVVPGSAGGGVAGFR